MNFVDAVKTVATINYAKFDGRAGRPEYWWWVLFNVIVGAIFWVLMSIVSAFYYLYVIYMLAVIVPGIGVTIRRLHDLGKSGWWLLIALTGIGALVLLYWFAQPGDQGDNQYGPPPAA
jgi:uncharacterized membrane protein YhaH (DUF805 family)